MASHTVPDPLARSESAQKVPVDFDRAVWYPDLVDIFRICDEMRDGHLTAAQGKALLDQLIFPTRPIINPAPTTTQSSDVHTE